MGSNKSSEEQNHDLLHFLQTAIALSIAFQCRSTFWAISTRKLALFMNNASCLSEYFLATTNDILYCIYYYWWSGGFQNKKKKRNS